MGSKYIQTVRITIREGICSQNTQAEGQKQLLQMHFRDFTGNDLNKNTKADSDLKR